MSKDTKRSFCAGCRNNFYNQSGNSSTGECWLLQTATVVDRTQVGIWQNPPYRWTPQKTLSCHSPDGMTWIKRDDCRLVENGAKRHDG